MADIVLTQVRIGMGNPVHAHVHRHNMLNLESQNIDKMLMATSQGGIVESLMNNIAGQSGGLTVNPRGIVNIEDTYNQRRGLCMLNFSVQVNALVEEKLVVLCYLTGGEPQEDGGIDSATLAVPVRSWVINTENVTNPMNGLPMIKNAVTSSNQILMGDPTAQRHLRSMRPEDIGNEVLGYISTEQEGAQGSYHGNVAANLDKTVLVSKTQNLDTTHHAKQLLKIATNLLHDADYNTPIQDSVAGTLFSGSMTESLLSENPFFKAMATATASWSWAGFQGYTLGEIAETFQNFTDVLDLNMLDESTFKMVDEVAFSTAYGATNLEETTAQEIAMLTVDLLIRCGLTHVVFAASNNPYESNGMVSEDGVEVVTGEWMSIVDQDPNSIGRLQRFIQMFKDKFYTKFNTGYGHSSTIVNIKVTCWLFGETSVEVFFNGDVNTTERYVNATYYLARTSSNIAASETGVNESVNFLNNLREYFISPN